MIAKTGKIANFELKNSSLKANAGDPDTKYVIAMIADNEDDEFLVGDGIAVPDGAGADTTKPGVGFIIASGSTASSSLRAGANFEATDGSGNVTNIGNMTIPAGIYNYWVGSDLGIGFSAGTKDEFIRYHEYTGSGFESGVTIKSERFYLGSTSQYVSGSLGNIEISSSKLHLKPDGDIVVRKVSAIDGTIGGYDISSNNIQASDTTGNVTNTLRLTSGATSQVQLKADDSSTKRRNTVLIKNESDHQSSTFTYFPNTDNSSGFNKFIRTRLGSGIGEGIPGYKTTTDPDGMSLTFDYHNGFGEPYGNPGFGQPQHFPFSESIQFLIASASAESADKGVTMRYLVHHKMTGDQGITNDDSGEMLRIGKVKDTHGDFNTATAPNNRVFHYGISGSAHTTASFGVYYGDGQHLDGVVALPFSEHVLPSANATYDLGSKTARWRDLWTSDIQLSNEGTKGNEVDGTTGSWTIQEGQDDLYLLNRKTGKKYRFKLEEIT